MELPTLTPPTYPNALNLESTKLEKTPFIFFEQTLHLYTHTFNAFWNNPSFTPTQLLAALGTKAYPLFVWHYGIGLQLTELAASLNKSFSPLVPPTTITWNLDGSGTIN